MTSLDIWGIVGRFPVGVRDLCLVQTAWYAGQRGTAVRLWPAYQAVTYTEWYIPDNVLFQFDSPDDEHWVARNMYRSEINKYTEKSASSWLLTRIRKITATLTNKLWASDPVLLVYDIASGGSRILLHYFLACRPSKTSTSRIFVRWCTIPISEVTRFLNDQCWMRQ